MEQKSANIAAIGHRKGSSKTQFLTVETKGVVSQGFGLSGGAEHLQSLVKYCLGSSATRARSVTMTMGVDVELIAVGRRRNAADPDIGFLEEPPESTPLIRPASYHLACSRIPAFLAAYNSL